MLSCDAFNSLAQAFANTGGKMKVVSLLVIEHVRLAPEIQERFEGHFMESRGFLW